MIDIIVINYLSTHELFKCLATIHTQKYSPVRRIIVCENGPEDLGRVLCDSFRHLVYIKNQKNLGFAAAVNAGIHKSDAPYIMLLNPDTRLADGFFDVVYAYLEKNRQVGVLGPGILNEDGTIQGSARSFPTPLTGLFGRTSFLTRVLPGNRISRKNILTDRPIPYGEALPVDWVSGACMVVRREAVCEIGLMDTRFFMYWEDADWCRRMKSAGWEVVYFPSATIVHMTGKSSEKRRFGSLLSFHASAYRYFAKYAGRHGSILKPIVFLALAIRFYCKCIGIMTLYR